MIVNSTNLRLIYGDTPESITRVPIKLVCVEMVFAVGISRAILATLTSAESPKSLALDTPPTFILTVPDALDPT